MRDGAYTIHIIDVTNVTVFGMGSNFMAMKHNRNTVQNDYILESVCRYLVIIPKSNE